MTEKEVSRILCAQFVIKIEGTSEREIERERERRRRGVGNAVTFAGKMYARNVTRICFFINYFFFFMHSSAACIFLHYNRRKTPAYVCSAARCMKPPVRVTFPREKSFLTAFNTRSRI